MHRPWNEVDWGQARPSPEEVTASWGALRWSTVPVTEPAVLRYLEQVRATHVNGGCVVGRWRADTSSDAAAWFVSRNRLEEYELHRLLLDDPVVRADLAELRIPDRLGPVPAGLAEQWAGSLCLDGLLAGLLVAGGAYRSFDGTAAQAKELAGDAVDALVGRRYEDVRVDVSHEPWTPWFGGVAWDHTYVLTDRGRAEVTVLCVTDRD